MYKIGILEGDDIGLEVVPECVKVMKAAAAKAKERAIRAYMSDILNISDTVRRLLMKD